MRFYLLDKLICPHCGYFPLSVVVLEEHQGAAPVTNTRPCALYCAHEAEWLRNTSAEPPCSSCLKRQIWSGELVCSECGSRYPIDERIPNLLVEEAVDEWVKEEQTWWDKRYMKKRASQNDTIRVKRVVNEKEVPGNRYYERNTYLFAPLRQRGIQGRLVLEIGAGTSQYVADLLPPSAEHYFYVGTDVSREALTIGSQLLPEGDFIQCAAGKMPFRREIFDVLLSLGVLHHIPRWQSSLNQIIDLLKPGGWMLFEEVIEKPRVLGRFRKHSLTASIDSPHEGEIVFDELLEILFQKGAVIMWRLKSTPLRVLLVWALGRVMEKSLVVTKAVLDADQLFMKVAGKVFKSLGPREALGIFEKRQDEGTHHP